MGSQLLPRLMLMMDNSMVNIKSNLQLNPFPGVTDETGDPIVGAEHLCSSRSKDVCYSMAGIVRHPFYQHKFEARRTSYTINGAYFGQGVHTCA